MKLSVSLSLILLLGLVCELECSKIFFMIPLTTQSEKNLYTPLINELGKRGHQVTVASIKLSKYDSPNVKEFNPISYEEFMGSGSFSLRLMREYGNVMMYFFDSTYIHSACHKVYQNKQFQLAIKQEYDLIFTNYFFQHCFAGVLYLHKGPFIILSSMAPIPYVFELTGYKIPMSFVPNPLFLATDKMSFMQRVQNLLSDFYWTTFTKFSYIPGSTQIYREYLGENLPGGFEIESNVSLIFSNSHYTLNSVVPVLPQIVEIGGIHCQLPKKLPKNIEEFVSGAKDGFIYFSMGSFVKGNSMPKEWVDIFIEVFSKLQQRVLWKWEDDQDLSKFPANVMVQKWMPQQDILGHPNIRLFISHGGGLSTQESIYHGVPLIGFPIFMDQNLNMMNAESRGFAIMMELLELSSDSLGNAINKVLTDPKFKETAKELSSLFRDQQETPLERAVYYTEYTIRNKGTKHMRSSGKDLTFFQYYMWDVHAFILICILMFFLVIIFALRFIFRLILRMLKFQTKTDAKREKEKKQN